MQYLQVHGLDLSCLSIMQVIYFTAGIFDTFNVACKPLQKLKTLAVGLFYFILLHRIRI